MNPAIILLLAQGAQMAGSAYGALSAVKNSKYAADIADYHAKYVSTINQIEAGKLARYRDQVISSQRAAFGASGIAAYDETTKELEIETKLLYGIDAEILKINGSIEALRYSMEGQMNRAGAYSTAAQFGAQGFGSLLSAVGSYGDRAGWFRPSQPSSLLTQTPVTRTK
jgi:hypothetical protein